MKKRTIVFFTLFTAYMLLVRLLELVEKGNPQSNIQNFMDALWYFLVTMSTVGYGDKMPLTLGGKLIGLVFVLSSVGVLTAMIGIGLHFVGGTLIPRLRLLYGKSLVWYAFGEWNIDTETLARALYQERPNSILIVPETNHIQPEVGNLIRYPVNAERLLRIRGKSEGLYLFFMSENSWENYALATAAAKCGVHSYCMGGIAPEHLPEHLQLFNLLEVVSRKYWDEHPLLESERNVVLIGRGRYGMALLERALLTNIFIQERGIEYHFFGDTRLFTNLHPEILKEMENSSGDRVILHEEEWLSRRELLLNAHRIILCEDEDAQNLTNCELLHNWYVSRALVHIRLDQAIPGFSCFGEKVATLTPEYVMKDELNYRAILMNEIYNQGSANPTPWRGLSPFLEASNIAAADHLLVKARCLLKDETLTEISLEDCGRAYQIYREQYLEKADLFQEMEHRRWMRFYQMYNWRYAPERENALRLHPLLRPYQELSPEDRRKNAYAWEMLGELAKNKGK